MPRDGEPEDVDSAAWGAPASGPVADDIVPIEMEGDGPLVVREKFHLARPMAIDQALFEMELVGHDFFLFRDLDDGCPSVVYRRQGYQYGVIRLVEEGTEGTAAASAALGRTNGQARSTAAGRGWRSGARRRGDRRAPACFAGARRQEFDHAAGADLRRSRGAAAAAGSPSQEWPGRRRHGRKSRQQRGTAGCLATDRADPHADRR